MELLDRSSNPVQFSPKDHCQSLPSMTAIAIAWIIAKGCCLIVGLANESQLDGLLEALIVTLSEGDIKRLGEECEPLRHVFEEASAEILHEEYADPNTLKTSLLEALIRKYISYRI